MKPPPDPLDRTPITGATTAPITDPAHIALGDEQYRRHNTEWQVRYVNQGVVSPREEWIPITNYTVVAMLDEIARLRSLLPS
jgi:hypothetical protein